MKTCLQTDLCRILHIGLEMTGVLLILFVVFYPLVLSESGDDDMLDGEDVTCSYCLTMSQSKLMCSLNDEFTEEIKVATLCKNMDTKECIHATLGPQGFTFYNLSSLLIYDLQINTSEVFIKKTIKLTKIVKIPAPQIKLVTYMEDLEECFIWIEHKHDFVKDLEFQIKVLGGQAAEMVISAKNSNLTLGRDILGGDGIYDFRVRAKPVKDYFDGMWSEWSSNARFTITTTGKARNIDQWTNGPIVILIIISVVLVFIIGFGGLKWRTQIRGYMKPNIPHPKATLAQIHRAKEGFPFTFSPEIFSDVFIHSVDYVDETPSAPDLQEDLYEHCDSRSSSAGSRPALLCEMDTKATELLPTEQSHLKIRLLDESDFSEERERGRSEGITILQRECKDEAYVTMSSLFKTQ